MVEKKSYSGLLKDPRWQKKRLEVMQRDNFTCCLCKDDKITLHVHHLKYSGNPWDVEINDLQTLCEHCHSVLHYAENHEEISISEIKNVLKKALIVEGELDYSVINVFILTNQLRVFQIENNSVELLFRMTIETINDLYNFTNG